MRSRDSHREQGQFLAQLSYFTMSSSSAGVEPGKAGNLIVVLPSFSLLIYQPISVWGLLMSSRSIALLLAPLQLASRNVWFQRNSPIYSYFLRHIRGQQEIYTMKSK